ncbi:MAG TPA: PAS domain-containing sensor histidine kinase [Nitrososphaera sp.]|nr:PAS domain-containing sensor histidine kinase [Nitrososphaera sp.]
MKQRAYRSLNRDKSTFNRYSRTYKILEDLYERSPVLYCIVDTEGIILDCNEAYVDRLGYARTQAVGMAIFDHVTSNNLVAMHEYLEKWRKHGHIENCEVWLKKKNGDMFPALLSASSLHDEHRTLVGCNIALIDQTDIYKTKKDVEKANEELKLKEQLKNQFIAIASHELRTPIQPLLGYAILAKRGKVSQEAAWEGVLKEARRLQQLANDILDVSRIESESLMYQMDKVTIGSLLESVVDSARGSLTNNVSMELLFDDVSKELEVDLDRPRMIQVLSNIIGNAVKFTKRGSIKIECRAFANKNKLEIRVSDTGTGISQEILPNLFGKFVTKSSGDIEGHGGTGLGLFISKAIVNAHKGEIFAYNNATGGATFTMVLPIDQSNIIYD